MERKVLMVIQVGKTWNYHQNFFAARISMFDVVVF